MKKIFEDEVGFNTIFHINCSFNIDQTKKCLNGGHNKLSIIIVYVAVAWCSSSSLLLLLFVAAAKLLLLQLLEDVVIDAIFSFSSFGICFFGNT